MLNKIHIDNIDKKIKSIFSIFFISIIAYGFTSCADSMEDTFFKFTHVPFFEYENYSLWDRESSTYFIDYESARYIARIPVDSDELISIVRIEHEPSDSTRVYPVYDISELIKKDICNICLIFRSVWMTDYKQIYLQYLSVINGDYAILTIFWKKTECVYYVYIRNQSSDNLSEWNRITMESHMNKISNDIWYSTHQVYPNQ